MAIKKFKIKRILSGLLLATLLINQMPVNLLADDTNVGISNNNNTSNLTGQNSNTQGTTSTTSGGAEGGSMITDTKNMDDKYKSVKMLNGSTINLYDFLTDKEIEFRNDPAFINKLKSNLDTYISTFKSAVDAYNSKYGNYLSSKELFDANGNIYSGNLATEYTLTAETIQLEFYGMRVFTVFNTLNQIGQATDVKDKFEEFMKYAFDLVMPESVSTPGASGDFKFHASPYHKGKSNSSDYVSIYHRLVSNYLKASVSYIPDTEKDLKSFIESTTMPDSAIKLSPLTTSLRLATVFISGNNLYSTVVKTPGIAETIKTDSDTVLNDWMTPIMYQLLGGTTTTVLDSTLQAEFPNGNASVENSTTTKQLATDMKDGYVILKAVSDELADLYTIFGYTSRAQSFLNDINESYKNYEENYLVKLGLSSIENKDTQNSSSPAENQIYTTVKDIMSKQEYYELFAWTSNFTPFETNINDMTDMSETLSKEAKAIYNTYGLLRTPIYAVESNTALLSHIKKGNIRSVNYITLKEFIDKLPNGDIALLANKLSFSDIAKNKAGLVISSQENEEGSATTISSADTNNSTANPDKFIGPIYMSSNDINYGTTKGSNNLEDIAKNESNGSTKTTTITVSEGTVIEQTISNSASVIASSAQHLTAQHLYYNYMMMWNTLQDGKQNTEGIAEDMGNPLYIDFLGNIVTQSGYIVVPAAANTTYYNDISEFPILNAMFLNSYPKVSVDSNSTIQLSDADKNKFVLAVQKDETKVIDMTGGSKAEEVISNGVSSKKYKWKLIRYDSKDMSKSRERLYVSSPAQSFYMQTEMSDGIKIKPTANSEVIDMVDISTSFLDVGLPYVKWGFLNETSDAKVYSLNNFQNIRYAVDGQIITVALDSISSIPTSSSWKAITSLIKGHLLLEENGLTVIRTEEMLSKIMTSVLQGSTDPTQMLYDYEFEDYKEQLKGDKILSFAGSLLESFMNMVFSFIDDNVLLNTPTAQNMNRGLNAHLWITPLSIALVIIVIIVVISALIFRNISDDGSNIGESLSVFAMIMFITIYNLQIHPHVTKFVFDTVPSRIINKQQALYVAYEIEKEYKDGSDYFFSKSKNNKNMENRIIVKIKELTKEEALQMRKEEGSRPEVFTKFYNVEYDMNPLNLVGEMYLKGTSVYCPLDYILEGAYLRDNTNANNTFNMDVELYDDGGILSNYVAFYNILDSLVYTANAYTEGSSVALRILQYSNFAMTTGRAQSYFNSIYFVAPDKVNDILKVYEEQYVKNIDDILDKSMVGYGELYQKKLLEAQDQATMLLDAYVYMLDKLGDLDDWLGLKRVLFLNEGTNYPFTEDMKPKVQHSYWYPNLDKYTEDEINAKILKINNKVRNYVLTEMSDILGYMSDDTIFKVIAWQATMEFNKEFSDILSSNSDKLYPQQLESDSLGNKFFIQSTYMPTSHIFNSSTTSFSYYVASEYGYLALLLLLIDIPIKFLIYLIPFVGIYALIFIPYLLILFYFIRRSNITKKIYGVMMVCCFTALLRLILVLAYRINLMLTGYFNLIGVTFIALILNMLILTAFYQICKYTLKNTDNVLGLLTGVVRGKLATVTDGYGGHSYISNDSFSRNRYQHDLYDDEDDDIIDLGDLNHVNEPNLRTRNRIEVDYGYDDISLGRQRIKPPTAHRRMSLDEIESSKGQSIEEIIENRFKDNPNMRDFDSIM